MKKIICLFILLNSYFCYGKYKIAIYTDQVSKKKANDVVRYFKSTKPFSTFDFDFVIIQKSSSFLNCKSLDGMSRLIGCDVNLITKDAAKNGYDQAFVVSDSPNYGGGGGSLSVITSSEKNPVSMMAHEYMHTLGFGDEYSYSVDEAVLFCSRREIQSYINLTIIKPHPSGYSNDQDARRRHRRKIPWYKKINATTFISSKSLGTPSSQISKIGLFKSDTCKNALEKIFLWKPGNATIMKSLSAPVGVLSGLLVDSLRSLGISFKKNKRSVFPKNWFIQKDKYHSCSHQDNIF